MKLDYYCGCYKTGFSFFGEPDECSSQGTIKVDEEDWEEGLVSFQCPDCGNLLCQSDGHFKEH